MKRATSCFCSLRIFATFWKCVVLTKWRKWVMEGKINREYKKWNSLVCRDRNFRPFAPKTQLCRPLAWLPHLHLAGVPLSHWPLWGAPAERLCLWFCLPCDLTPSGLWAEAPCRAQGPMRWSCWAFRGTRERQDKNSALLTSTHQSSKYWLCGIITNSLAVQRREVRRAGRGLGNTSHP